MSTASSRFHDTRVLIFDLDGTLIDSGEDLARSVNATLEKLGRSPLPHERIFGYVGQGAARLIERALGPGATHQECAEGLASFLSYYRTHMLDHTVTYPGVREGLAALEGMPMAVLTNKPVRFSKAILEGLGLARYFQYVYGGNSFDTKKPDPAGMHVLLRDFAVEPKQAMLIGDSNVDVQTARNAGTWACCVTYGLGTDGLAADPPDLLLDSLTELLPYLDAQATNSAADSAEPSKLFVWEPSLLGLGALICKSTWPSEIEFVGPSHPTEVHRAPLPTGYTAQYRYGDFDLSGLGLAHILVSRSGCHTAVPATKSH